MGLNIGLDSEYTQHKVCMCVRLCVRLAENRETAVKKALHGSCPRFAGTTHTTCSLPTAALTPHAELTIRENPYIHNFPILHFGSDTLQSIFYDFSGCALLLYETHHVL